MPSQENLRERFLRAREKMRSSRSDAATARQTEPKRATTTSPKPKIATPEQKPKLQSIPSPDSQPLPKPETSRPPPAPSPSRNEAEDRVTEQRAPIVIEKIGEVDEDEEEAPQPPAPPVKEERRGWWIFGKSKERDRENYRFLTPSIRREIVAPKIRRGRWKYIVVHNSGSPNGNARIFDYYHRRVRKMRNGMAYHFVIGNGSASPNGRIEVGERWRRQINGGHVASDYLNNIAIGICLVGDFNRNLPTANQLSALTELIEHLRKVAGNKRRRTPIVRGHRDINPKPTDCPGNRWMSTGWLKRKFY